MPDEVITPAVGGKTVSVTTVVTTTETRFVPDDPTGPIDPPIEPPSGNVRTISVDGTGDGLTAPAPITALNEMIRDVGPGGEVRIEAGDYKLTGPIKIDEGGDVGKLVSVVAVGSVRLQGDRFYWDGRPINVSGKKVGMNCFDFGPNANCLEFSGLQIHDFGRVFNVDKHRLKDWKLNLLAVRNVRSFLYLDGSDTDSEANYGAIDGLAANDVHVFGFSKDAMRIYGFSKNWSVDRFTFDSGKQDGDNFCIGAHVSGKAENITLSNGKVANCIQTNKPGYKYWNGDGLAAERKCNDVEFSNITVDGCSDGGFDIKTPGAVIKNCSGTGNKRNLRLWDKTIKVKNFKSKNPKKLGGSGGIAHVWLDSKSIPKDEIPDLSTVTIEGAPKDKVSW